MKQPLLHVVCFIFWCLCVFISGSTPSGGGGGRDWLGLNGGDDDGGLDLNNVPRKNKYTISERAKRTWQAHKVHTFLPFIVKSCLHSTSLFYRLVFNTHCLLCRFSDFGFPGTSREASVTAKKSQPAPGRRWQRCGGLRVHVGNHSRRASNAKSDGFSFR